MSEQKEQNEAVEIDAQEEMDTPVNENKETVETAEDHTEETEEHTADSVSEEHTEAEPEEEKQESADIDAHIANLTKHDAAILLIKKAKHIVHDAEAQMDACQMLLSDDLKEFEQAKQSLMEGGMDESEALLNALGYSKDENGEDQEEEEDRVVFETKEEIPPVYIRDISSGKFTGFILALLAGLVTLIGMLYVATEKVGVTLDVSKIPSKEVLDKVLGWYGSFIGRADDAMVGGSIVLIAVLLVMWIVYKIRVSLKAGSNLHFAKEQLRKAEEYASAKGTCKDEMDKVDAHIKDAVSTLKTYEVVLHEQQGKLKRIQHIEQSGEETPEYHEKSLKEMDDTYDLIKTIKEFLNTPMSEEGKLSGKSTLFLYRAKNRLARMIERFYQ